MGYTGYLKDKKSSGSNENIKEFSFVKGVLAAVLVGITGSAMSLGIEQGLIISEMAIQKGANPFFAIRDKISMSRLTRADFVTIPTGWLHSARTSRISRVIRHSFSTG